MKKLLVLGAALASASLAAPLDVTRGEQAPPAPAPAAAPAFEVAVSGQAIASFANSLGTQVGRPVLDETGLRGTYDFTLTFMPDSGGRGMPPGLLPPGAPELPPVDPNAPALPTALQDSLA